MNLIFAINMSGAYSIILTDEGIDKRLFSYWLLKDTKKGFLKEYTRTGLLPKSKRKAKKRHTKRERLKDDI